MATSPHPEHRHDPAPVRRAAEDGAAGCAEGAASMHCLPVAGLVHPVEHGVLARSADPTGADPLGGQQVSAGIADSLGRSRGSGDRLPQPLAQDLGGQLGLDLSGVRVHTDRAADTLARSLQSVAFTHGSDVYFSAGAYDPGSERGQHLLAHELTHVVQNSRGPGSASGLTVGRADDPAEAEADRSAARVVSALRRRAAVTGAAPVADRATGDQLRRRASVATLRRARAQGDTSPVSNDDLEMEFHGSDKDSAELTPARGGKGKMYVGSPGEGFEGEITLDPNAPGPVTVEGGFLQKLVVNKVKGDYGTEEEQDISFAEDPAGPHKDPPSVGGAWTYESDQPEAQVLQPGAKASWEDLDRPMVAFPMVEEDKPLNFWDAELGFETVFLARVKDTGQPWTQVEGKWEWTAYGEPGAVGHNEVESIKSSTQKAAEAWDPEQIRTLPHANGLSATWRRR